MSQGEHDGRTSRRPDKDDWGTLKVTAIVADREAIELMQRALERTGDHLDVAENLTLGLTCVAQAKPDVVFIELGMGKSAGLAVVHHIQAIASGTRVYGLARADQLELGQQAVALGGAGVLSLPLLGDELLSAVGDVRSRIGQRRYSEHLERREREAERTQASVSSIAELGRAPSRNRAAQQLATILVQQAGATMASVYLVAGEGAREHMLAASVGPGPEVPSFGQEIDLMGFAHENGLEVLAFRVGTEANGLALLGGLEPPPDGRRPLWDLLAAQAATTLALVGEREQAHRGVMKDPRSSAYTFAYFVDVAGREIDKARRYDRRFALATVQIGDLDVQNLEELAVQAAERVLAGVRDADVVARVDDNEFYLLLPETGGMGAHTCRRRVMRRLNDAGGLRLANSASVDVAVGVATYPHDGSDLSQLLRVAKQRAEQSRQSVVQRARLAELGLFDLLHRLLPLDGRLPFSGEPEVGDPQYLKLPTTELLGLAAYVVAEAARGGRTRVVATQRAGVCMGAAVRAAFGHDSSGVAFDAVDVGRVPGCEDLEVLAVFAEHGAYLFVGHAEAGGVRGLHSSDPLLADLFVQRLGDATGARLFD